MVYPTAKLPFEELTTIDERVDYVHNQLVAVQLALNSLLEKEGKPTMAVVTRQVSLRATMEKETGIRIEKPSPLTGTIIQVMPHWPPGCLTYVDIAFGHGDTWVMPSEVDTFLSLDDATPVFQYSEPIAKGEVLWMIAKNADSLWPHTVSVVATIVGVE